MLSILFTLMSPISPYFASVSNNSKSGIAVKTNVKAGTVEQDNPIGL